MTIPRNFASLAANTNTAGQITSSGLAATAVTAGTYGGNQLQRIIVDAQGRITGAANVSSSTFFTDGTNVGIGTSSPTSKLQISNSTAIDTQAQITNSLSTTKLSTFADGTTGIETTGAYAQRFLVNGSERMRIDSAGNVGIGAVSPAVSLDLRTKTDALAFPVGTTAQRPGTPLSGYARMNSDIGLPEWYDSVNTQWVPFNSGISVQYIIVGGGGGGGGVNNTASGGGGAGGYLTGTYYVTPGGSYTVTVGGGGGGGSGSGGGDGNGATGTSGSNSVFGPTITSLGGGGGGCRSNYGAGGASDPAAGGSGGGAGCNNTIAAPGTVGQGRAGGIGGTATLPSASGGGGGGASAVGNAGPSSTVGGAGGAGTADTWTGSSRTLAGGGGGGASGTAGAGGAGNSASGNGAAGTTNAGGGGNGTYANQARNNGGSGGSGIVVIRYLGSARGTGGTITSSGGYTIHTFLSSGTFNIS
jgi:hypothetical protein